MNKPRKHNSSPGPGKGIKTIPIANMGNPIIAIKLRNNIFFIRDTFISIN